MSNTSGRITDLQTELELRKGEKWLRRMKLRNSEGNAKRKRIALEQFDEFLCSELSGISLDDVDNLILEEFSEWLVDEKGLAHSTVPGRWYDVRSYLNATVDEDLGYLEGDDYILDWLDSGTETERELDPDVHWLPQDKIQQLIDGAKNLKNRLVIELLYNTGCRPSEISRMKLRRTYPKERRIKVKTSKVDTGANNSDRNVFWSRSMDRTMREWLDRGGRASYAHADDSPYLVVGYNTPSIGSRQVNEIVKMAADEAGIQEDTIETASGVDINRVTAKTLRHSFAVHSVRGRERSGTPPMDLERLRRLMGHSDLDTSSHYLQYRSSDLKDAFDRCHPA